MKCKENCATAYSEKRGQTKYLLKYQMLNFLCILTQRNIQPKGL